MNMRKLLSIILAFVLVMGTVSPCFPVWGAETEHQHTYGQWTFDTAKGTQSRTCSGCSEVQTLHGTTNKAEQVTEPVVGSSYYLAANVAGVLQYFCTPPTGGSVTNTVPYSLYTTESAEDAKRITLEDPTKATEGTSVGFQLTYLNGSTTTRIYCYDVKTDGANRNVMDTGTNSANYKGRHTFEIAEVSGMKVLRKLSNNNILVVKKNTTRNEWRMLGVPASELGTDGVYPVMLVNNHTHSYSTTLEANATHHWKVCDCGAQAEKATHTFGAWSFDTAKGTQSRTCTGCSRVEVLHGTTNKAEQVTEPAIGGQYYLAANVAGVLQYFCTPPTGGSVTNTTPYSLYTTESAENAQRITLEDPTKATEGTSVGFQLTYLNGSTTTRIYCYDVKTDGANRGVMDTGTNTANYKGRHTFEIAEVSGMKVLRKLSNNNILVVKKNTTRNEWRMLGVPASELGTDGVYPAMLVNNHTHAYGTTYEKDAAQHWQICDCGHVTPKADHDFTNGACVCGAEYAPHDCQSTDGKWYAEGNKHYQLCGTCNKKINETDHTYSGWTVDTANGTRSKICTACKYVGEVFYGNETLYSQVKTPTVGSTYYMAANVNGTLYSFISGGVTETSPYSLKTSTTLATVTVNEALVAGQGEFQLVDASSRYVYSIADGVGLTTSGNYVTYPEKVSFLMDTVNGVRVIRGYGTNQILAAKYSTAKGAWRIFPVTDSEIGTDGVYPVMLMQLHTHTPAATFSTDDTQHWHACTVCDSKLDAENHEYVKTGSDRVCECGKVAPPHTCQSTDGKWYVEGNKHYQLCGTCLEKIQEGEHTLGNWVFDTEKGSQSKFCVTCQHAVETLHGTTTKATQVTAPTVGSTYYLAANVKGDLLSILTNGGYTETSPYSIKTTTTLDTVTLKAALQSGKGEFQLEASDGKLLYSVAEGVGATTSVNYINDPERVSFFTDVVNGITVLRAYGTQKILAVKYSDAKSAWRIFPVADSEIGNEGVYPVMLVQLHTHTPTTTYEKDATQHWYVCTTCDGKVDAENHEYVKTGSDRVCKCGQVAPLHTCQSANGKWFTEGNKHYQVCGICLERIFVGEHTFGSWVFDAEKGIQTRACSSCNLEDVLHGTGNKVTQVTAPALGKEYYMVANVDGQIHFFRHGTATDTAPYSLWVTDNLNHNWVSKVTVEDPTVAQENTGEGFQLTYVRPDTEVLTRIYCYDVLKDETVPGQTGVIDTGINTVNFRNRHTFIMDEVGGVKVLRQISNRNVLVVKFNDASACYRLVAVPESELANQGVYPVMLAELHEHDFGSGYQKDETNHWQHCATCDSKLDVKKHEYVKNSSGDRVCQCGKVMPKHTCKSGDGKWYSAAGKHYQVCGICQEKIKEASHTYGKWTFDTAKGTQSATCKTCSITETLHGTSDKVYKVTEPAIGDSYYLVANVDGKLQYFVMEGSVADTVPYSLHVTDKADNENIYQITTEAPVDGTEGFQLTFVRNSDDVLLRIYCYNAETTNDAMDTGMNTGNELPKHTFKVDTVNGVQVLRKLGNNSVLAVKFNESVGTYRIVGVEEEELANEGVYPVMLATMHEHAFGSGYEQDASNHWKYCADCDSKLEVEKHDYVKNSSGKRVCECGKVMPKHTCKSSDGKWFTAAGKHYQVCGVCQDKIKEASHTYGKWTFDTAKGTQTATCKVCGIAETLHGTSDKVYQVAEPAIGNTYYLAANVDGTLQYFVVEGSVADTVPYSLHATDNLSNANIQQVTLETPASGTEGFQLTYVRASDNTTLRIYCYNAETTNDAMDTGMNTGNELPKHTFKVDTVNGTKVLRKLGNNSVLAVKFNESVGTYRIVGVEEEELANEGVYPVMLATMHEHAFGSGYEQDERNHWKYCADCDSKLEVQRHHYVMNDSGKRVCECGKVMPKHTCKSADGKWFAAAGKHYQVCDVCLDKIKESSHTYGKWTFDTAKGTQTATCKICKTVDVLHGTANKVYQVTEPVIGNSYYLVANVNGTLQYFVVEGSVADTVPYSLHATDNLSNANIQQVTLETPASGTEGFQLTYVRASDNTTLRIYCYNAETTNDALDTGINSGNELPKHTFKVDTVNGIQVLRKLANNSVLALKFNKETGTYRMLGVDEKELGKADVYPVMLATMHEHAFGSGYEQDERNHWKYCADCDSKLEVQRHHYVMNDAGKRVCECGKVMPKHTCKSADGKWFAAAGKHYQVCDICLDKIEEAYHTYGKWTFDTENGIQTATCKICKTVDILHGTDNKVYEITEPAIGDSYYLVANVKGKLQYFVMEGSVADTVPYSLHATDDLSNQNIKQVTLEAPASGTEGFQLSFVRASDNMTLRIYCYNAETTNDALDTGINSGNELPKHTFKVDTVNGIKVLRKLSNNYVLALKFNEETGTYRMLGVDEKELGSAGVYPVMLAVQHAHSLSKDYVQDTYQHWHFCASCDSKIGVENHNYVMNETGKRVCECGKVMPKHTCKSADGKWYALAGKHYQVCAICYDRVQEADHAYGKWTFNTKEGTQTATCKVCKTVDTLHGTETKGYQILDPKLGETYYLAANVNGKLHFFRHGTVTDTIPYSLWVTEDVNHEWVMPVTLEDPTVTEEKTATGFQLTYANPTNDVHSRIYCMDVLKDETVAGQTGVMDTGINSGLAYKNRHNFTLKQVDGQTVLSKTGNDNVLVVKYDANLETYRLMGVPASELGKEGVYPAMLMLLHEHTHTDETYLHDELGHWYACSCGGKSNYEDHVVTKWTYIKEPTQTTGGQKTGTCILCGGKAVIDIPPMVAEGHYYLTGKVDGKTYYFRDKTANESVEHTAPFSLMTSSNKKDALNVNVAWDEKANTYVLSYTVTRTLNIYMGDVNGSTVAADGLVDLGASGTTSESMITFRWDVANKRFYQMERGIRYVIAFEKMTLTDGTKAVRMRAVPESELSENIVAAKLQLVHKHEYSEKWHSDAVNHWLECSCGARKYEAAHTVPTWKVERKATEEAAGKKSGTCSFCKLDVVNAIPMITDKIKAPEHGDKFYLKGIVDGKEYYFCHTPVGGSVADTYPYSLYTDPGTGFVTPLTVKEKDGVYNLFYGTSNLYLYISGDGVGITSNTDRKDLIDFLWDEENKVLYQMEGDVKYVLVFMVLRNNSGKDMVRITAMPLDRALIDPTVSLTSFTTKAPAGADVSALPKDATLLDNAQQQAPGEEAPTDGAVYENLSGENDQGFVKLVIALAIAAVALAGIIVLAVLAKNGVIGAAFFRRWNLWAGISFVAAGLVLAAAMILPGILKPAAPGLETFTIVANEISMEDAEALAVEIYEDHGISLPVVHCDDFHGNNGIFVNVSGFNSYGGYKYRISNQKDDGSAGVYLDGTGPALEVAISKWTKSVKKAPSFPFGITEDVVGYEWNTGDVNMTGLGFELEEMISRELYEGVELKELKYNSFAYGKSTGYAVIVDSDAPVELKVSAGEWDENTNPDNPGEKFTVQQHGKRLTKAGYEVLAITNAGFYDLNTTMTYIPWGMQIVDGLVKKEPNKDNPKNTDNWFAQTADGKYVISNTDGYNETYETKLSDGVGGGLMLMENGKPCFTATTPDYRTVVGITKDGDLVILTISGANYAVVTQAFMDMQIEVDCILNLDGGGSTTMHALNEEGKLQQYICETPVEREVADAIAIVKKN